MHLRTEGGRSTPTYWSDPKNFHTVENNVAMPYVEMYQTNPHPLLQKDTPWKQITSNRVPRSGHSALVIGSTLLMMGGEGVWQSSVATVETLDLSDSTFPWSLQQPMLSARAFHAGVWFPTVSPPGIRSGTGTASTLNGTVCAVGGKMFKVSEPSHYKEVPRSNVAFAAQPTEMDSIGTMECTAFVY